jgi:copper(I)-binding protein
MMPNILLACAASLVMAASAMAQTGAVEITDAWARATPGGAENGAAYLTMAAPSGDRLTGISTPVAKQAELHAMKMEGGIMTMTPLPAIDLPPGRPVTLKPGTVHIMLSGLKQPLVAGQTVPLTLHFAKGGTREVMAAVGKVGAAGPESHAGGAMHPHNPAHH